MNPTGANNSQPLRELEWLAEYFQSHGREDKAQEILEELRQFKRMKEENEAMNLTLREVEIIQCIAADLTNKQIADKLFISERTVETHRKNIFRKTNIHSAVGLVDFARKRKLI